MGIVGSLFSGIFGGNAASKAANVEANASTHAADLQKQAADQALAFQKQVYGDTRSTIQPYINAGTGGLNALAYRLGIRMPSAATTNAAVPRPSNNLSNLGPAFDNNPILGNNGRGIGALNGGDATPMFANNFATRAATGGQNFLGLPSAPGGQNFDGGPISSTGIPGTAGPDGVMTPNGTIDASKGNLVTQFDPNGQPQINPNTGQPFPQAQGGTGATDGFGSLLQPFGETFHAPTDVTEQNDPGYQFRLKEGQKALQNSAAARGSLLTGGTAKAINAYGQDYASNEFNNVYNRSSNEFLNRYNIYNQDQNTVFNRLAAISGVGQTATGQLANSGQAAAGNNSSILLNSAGQQGVDLQNAAAARGSGYINQANAYTNMFKNLGGSASLLSLFGG